MPASPKDPTSRSSGEIAGYLDMPEERRVLAKTHVAVLSETAGRVALELPISADVDDFRRVLSERAEQ